MSTRLGDQAARGLTLGVASGGLLAGLAWWIGLAPLSDNSFLTHLATGRLILEHGEVPSADPYSFTAMGEPWVVQSWFASWLYASVEALWGGTGLRVLMGATSGLLAAAAWRLTRPALTLLPRFAAAGVFLAASAGMWSERPLLLGLLALAVVLLALAGDVPAWFLLPVGWVWANTHGSFPLAFVYLLVVGLGARFDGGSTEGVTQVGAWLAGGVALGMLGPLGLRAVIFPFQLLSRQDVLSHVVEWQPPTFTSFGQRAFLVLLLGGFVALTRRPSWRSALVLACFGVLALTSARNIPVAALVMLPEIARVVPTMGTLRARATGPAAWAVASVAVFAFVGGASVRLAQPDLRLDAYPVEALARSQVLGSAERPRLAAPDIVGNFMEAVEGPSGGVFADDRFDMFPNAVMQDHIDLVDGSPRIRTVLDRWKIQAVIWPRESSTGLWLVGDPEWHVVHMDDVWLLACRRAEVGALSSC